MSQRTESRGLRAVAFLTLALALAWPVRAQPGSSSAPAGPVAPTPLQSYLESRGVLWALAVELSDEVASARGSERARLASRLGRVYVELLDRATTQEQRDAIESQSRALLELVPESDSFDLRISLAKARYLSVERSGERHRLGLASDEERSQAVRVMGDVAAQLADLGMRAHRSAESIERRLENTRSDDERTLRAQIADLQRVRSTAMYYAGWSTYYQGLLTGSGALGEEALKRFGWLLNAEPGKAATLDRAPSGFFRLDHVARAAIGCALSEALRGRTDIALRWLESLASNPDLPDAVRDQLEMRTITVLAAGARWSDLEFQLDRRGREPAQPSDRSTSVAIARLVSVAALQALQREDTPKLARPLVERLARRGLAELASIGEAGHVLSLVRTFGSAQLGQSGFVVSYVRGLVRFDDARAAQEQAGEPTDQPTKSPTIAVVYREAGTILEGSLRAEDVEQFPSLRSSAGLMLGLALYQGGDPLRAADHLERLYHTLAQGPATPTDTDQLQEILWLSIVSLDSVQAPAGPALDKRRAEAAQVYLTNFPTGERSARLLLRRGSQPILPRERALAVLQSVPASSPMYEQAQTQIARLMYQDVRRLRGSARDAAAARFLPVAQRVLDTHRKRAQESTGEPRAQAIERALVVMRQMLDVLLGGSVPDTTRARSVLDMLAGMRGVDGLGDAADEIQYRRLQLAIAEGDEPGIEASWSTLARASGEWPVHAARRIFELGIAQRRKDPASVKAHERVVSAGSALLASAGTLEKALAKPGLASVANDTASSAAQLAERAGDRAMLELALRIDAQLVGAGLMTADGLVRRAEVAIRAGQSDAALEAWRLLLQGAPEGSDLWFRARYESLRLLAKLHPARARQAMDQHRTIHPDFGPEPWGPKLRALAQELDAAAIDPSDGGTP